MLIRNESIDDYHRHAAVSNSKLKDFDSRGPKFYYLRHVRRELAGRDTKALRAGRAFETYMFEPRNFEETFAVKPEGFKGTTSAGKDWKTEQELSGKIIIDRADYLNFEHMERAVRECDSAVALLEDGFYQPTYRIDWPGTPGLQTRPDWGNPEGCPRSGFQPYTLDVKTTRLLEDLTSGRGIVKYGYHGQAAVARLASELPETVNYLLAVEKAFPCRAIVIEVSRTFVNIGEDWATSTMARLAEHYESDHWPLTVDDSIVVEPPRWLLAEHDALGDDGADDDVEAGEHVDDEATGDAA